MKTLFIVSLLSLMTIPSFAKVSYRLESKNRDYIRIVKGQALIDLTDLSVTTDDMEGATDLLCTVRAEFTHNEMFLESIELPPRYLPMLETGKAYWSLYGDSKLKTYGYSGDFSFAKSTVEMSAEEVYEKAESLMLDLGARPNIKVENFKAYSYILGKTAESLSDIFVGKDYGPRVKCVMDVNLAWYEFIEFFNSHSEKTGLYIYPVIVD